MRFTVRDRGLASACFSSLFVDAGPSRPRGWIGAQGPRSRCSCSEVRPSTVGASCWRMPLDLQPRAPQCVARPAGLCQLHCPHKVVPKTTPKACSLVQIVSTVPCGGQRQQIACLLPSAPCVTFGGADDRRHAKGNAEAPHLQLHTRVSRIRYHIWVLQFSAGLGPTGSEACQSMSQHPKTIPRTVGAWPG